MKEEKPKEIGDVYGQVHPEETPELIKAKLAELEAEMEKIPTESKKCYGVAVQKCPQLLDEAFKLNFLRCEVYNVDLAASRLALYWETRVELFGPELAFKPLTQKEALRDDNVALSLGFARLLPSKDPSGRSIVFVDPSVQDRTLYTRESMVRCVWYVVHAAVEDEEAQKNGVLFLGHPRHAKFGQVDRTFMRMVMESLKGCIPVRMSGMHVCHPPSFFAVIFPLVKLFLGERLRKRIRVHAGSTEHVLRRLEKFGLTRDRLPTDIGGDITLDHSAWLAERKSEGK